MKFTGTITDVIIKIGKAPYGFIAPDLPVPGHDGDIRFFGDRLIEITIEDLQKGDLVEFSVTEWKKRYGAVEKVAEEVRRLNESTKLGQTSIAPINIPRPSRASTPVSMPRPITPVKSLPTYNIDSFDLKEIKEKVSLFLGSCTKISDPAEFEDYAFMVLRLLGIHNLYQYDKKNQAGKADGFFIIGSLVVMYDCTLRKDFDDHKKEQIENYVNKLKNSQITIDVRLTDGSARKKTLQIQGKNRQVWIITKNNTRELYDVDGIRVKEVSVQDLLKIFNKRLYSDAFEEDELSANLAVIDKS